MLKVIGIDPGLAATGIGIVKGSGLKVEGYSFGTIHTTKVLSLPHRLEKIFSRLLDVLRDEKPDLMVIEDVYSLPRYPKSGLNLGKVSGVILLAGCREKIPSTEVAVREVKQILTGNGNAKKEQLEKSVRALLKSPVAIKPDHASDALALALIGLFRHHNHRK